MCSKYLLVIEGGVLGKLAWQSSLFIKGALLKASGASMCFLFTCMIPQSFSGASHRTSLEIGSGSYVNKEVLEEW